MTHDHSPKVFQIKITLIGTKPPIWRRLLVPSDMTFAKLHKAVQIAMGWTDTHLHEFRVGDVTIGEPDPEARAFHGNNYISERSARLDQWMSAGGKAAYTYDFGDSWEHSIRVEKELAPNAEQSYPICIAGARNCPPEDCGGVWGFEEFLEAMANPDHERHEELREWYGRPFDPEEFSLDGINGALRQSFRAPKKKAAKTSRS